VKGGIFLFFLAGLFPWMPTCAGTVTPLKAQPRMKMRRFLVPRNTQTVVPAKAGTQSSMGLFSGPLLAQGWRVEVRVRWKRRIQCWPSD